jgi:hypothetical protein
VGVPHVLARDLGDADVVVVDATPHAYRARFGTGAVPDDS